MSEKPAYQDETLSFEERAKDLVSRMTLDEKVTQMVFNAPAIPRLGIPSYNWWNEALHGVARAGTATIFPQAIGMAATFDEDMIYKTADIISTEGRAKFHEFQRKGDHGIYKGLTYWSPNINIFRDPRWGRGQETYGEDPYLTGRLGVAFVKGIQGDHSKYLKAAACAKHYAVHSGPESERHSFNAVVSEKDLRETYLPAFKECVREAGVEGVMGAYNRTNDEPCCGSETLLRKILRGEWSFKGYVTSDCWAIANFHEEHRVTRTAPESVALAVNNTCDLNCGNLYANLLIAHKEGLIDEETIDQSVIRLMTIRMKLGLFDSPEKVPYSSIPYEVNDSDEHRSFALDVTKRTLVLLKNDNKLLPLDKEKIKSIAVIGPNANDKTVLEGNYFGNASAYSTVLEGVRNAVNPGTRVYYAEGCHIWKKDEKDIAEAVSAAERADAVVICLGLNPTIEGEEGDASSEYSNADKPHINLPGTQQELLEAVYATGKPVILVLLSGSAMGVEWADRNIPAIIQAWYPGAQGGNAIASLLFGEFSPSGRLPVTFYRSDSDLPDFRDYSMENRTYRYFKGEALYPFGYGLSYSTFEYSNLKLDKSTLHAGDSIRCSVLVKNTGDLEAVETVQLYLKDVKASVRVPRWDLRGVRAAALTPGEEKEVEFEIVSRQMALIDNEGKCIIEPGLFEVYVGGNQPDERSCSLTGKRVLMAGFEIVGEPLEVEY